MQSSFIALIVFQLASCLNGFRVGSYLFRREAIGTRLRQSTQLNEKKRVVVIGNGMVGQRFMENLIDLDKEKKCIISTFCEEPRAAYNRKYVNIVQ